MKLVPYENRKLTFEDAFSDVPELRVSGADEPRVSESGECWTKKIIGVGKKEFFEYLGLLEGTGWEPYAAHTRDPLQNIVYTASYTKNGRYLCAAFYDFDGVFLQPKIIVTVGLLPESHLADPEEVFKEIPDIPGQPSGGVRTADAGGGFGRRIIPLVEKEDYESYLKALEAAGFSKDYDNSDGFDGRVYAAGFSKNGATVSVSYISPTKQMCIIAGKRGFSPYLSDETDRRSALLPGACTSIHMLEMWGFGNSFVIRLKNGHFLVSDGGLRCEAPYLLDYLDSLTPEGEKPVVEGWFISHPHADHTGVLVELALNPVWGSRLRCEGIYFCEPPLELMSVDASHIGVVGLMRMVGKNLRTASGRPVPFYRPCIGERYFFADITLDVIMTYDLTRFKDFSGDLNDAGIWLMLTAEGQRVLLSGDGDLGGMKNIMSVYTTDYMNVDVMTALHHGWNTRNYFTNYCKPETVLFTAYGEGPEKRRAENAYLRSVARECISWGDGTVVLNFPYRVGEAERRSHFDFSLYNDGEERIALPNTGEKRKPQ
ncbi:MAG: hypothetical protein IKR26_00265 [Lachnospiraceae bacterium]|nr:hypothetical protein [Lachnospiraceae bacterium]